MQLPKEFHLPGTEVRIRRVGNGVLLEPIGPSAEDIRAIFKKLDEYRAIPFMEEGRPQPSTMPSDDVWFDK